MNLMKIMPAALLLTLSLGAYAQDEDELLNESVEEDSTEVSVPTSLTDRKTFHRVQIGYTGTFTKYTNFGYSPDYHNYFLNGISVGWMGDLRIAKKIGLFLELGAMFTFHTGASRGDSILTYPASQGGDEYVHHYRVKAMSVTIPVNINYQFKNVFGVKDLTFAPFIGAYARFNVMAKRFETETRTFYTYNADGSRVAIPGKTEEKEFSASLMSIDTDKRAIERKPHTGRLLQAGAQVGLNVYYKHYYAGLAYMHDLTPFARHYSEDGLTSKTTPQGGNLPSRGTGCDMEISTRHNFAITAGWIF